QRRSPSADLYGDPLPEGAVARLGTLRFRPGERVNAVASSPDGKRLAIGSDRTLTLWDVPSGKQLHLFKWHAGDIEMENLGATEAVAFSPDGKMLASGCLQDKTARLWDLASGRERHRL